MHCGFVAHVSHVDDDDDDDDDDVLQEVRIW